MIAGLAGPRTATRRDRLVEALIFDMVLALQLLLGTAGFGRNALFYSLVILHALAALAGFGSIGFAGTYAAGAYLPDDRPRSADPEPASAPPEAEGTPSQPEGAPAQPVSVPTQPADGTVQPEPGELGAAEVGGTVPDYETALRQYQAVLREFEASERQGEASETVGEPSGTVDEASRTLDETAAGHAGEATGHGEEVPSAAEEVVVAEVVVQAGPATTSEAVEQDVEAEEMRRYFAHPARLWGCLVLVPFLGAGALAAQPNGKGFDHPWVFGALAVWFAATLVAGSLVVPSLHQMQAVLLKSDNAGASPAARSSLAIRFARAGRIASRSAAFCDVLFLVALALMIFRP
jgi:hypothetical protein